MFLYFGFGMTDWDHEKNNQSPEITQTNSFCESISMTKAFVIGLAFL